MSTVGESTKRIDIAPTDENLIDLMEHNPIQRNEDLADFADILKSIEGGYTIFLDSDWGEGKTFFVKQLKLLLESANEDLPSDDRVASFLKGDPQSGSLANFKELNAFFPIYYNAWENDYWDDPLPSIAASIAQIDDISNEFQTKRSTPEKVAGILDGILEFVGRGNVIETIKEGFTGEYLIKEFSNRSTLRDLIKQLVDQILPDENNRLLLIIDELDRCKPSFALRVLEELKTLFELDQVIILYTLNTSQLIHSVEGEYGAGLDGPQYLSRFYDLKISLRKIPPKTYLEFKGCPYTTKRINRIENDIVEAYGMTLREVNRYISEVEKSQSVVLNQYKDDYIFTFIETGLIPVLLAIKIVRPNKYKEVVQDLNATPLYEAFGLSQNALLFLDQTYERSCNQYIDDFIQTGRDTELLDFIQALLYITWDSDFINTRHNDLCEYLIRSCQDASELHNLSNFI